MEMMTEEARWAYRSFVRAASALPGFEAKQKNDVREYDIGKLADGYCDAFDAGDEAGKSAYSAALMVRYWYMVPFMFRKYGHLPKLEITDVIGWIWDGISTACRYRGWRDPKQKVFGKRNSAEMCINQCITTTAGMACRKANRKSRKTDFLTNSLDAYVEQYEDGFAELASPEASDGYRLMIDKVAKGNAFDGFVLEQASSCDVYDVSDSRKIVAVDAFGEETESVSQTFAPNFDKLVRAVIEASKDGNAVKAYADDYGLPEANVRAMAERISKKKASEVASEVMDSLARLYEDDGVYEALCA